MTQQEEQKLREEFEKEFSVKISSHDSLDDSKAEVMNKMLKIERSILADYWIEKIKEREDEKMLLLGSRTVLEILKIQTIKKLRFI